MVWMMVRIMRRLAKRHETALIQALPIQVGQLLQTTLSPEVVRRREDGGNVVLVENGTTRSSQLEDAGIARMLDHALAAVPSSLETILQSHVIEAGVRCRVRFLGVGKCHLFR
jgi:hypothetical protein